MNKVEFDKHISAENFRKIGLDAVIADYLPIIREHLIRHDEECTELNNKLDAEMVKNAELHKVIKAISERKNDNETVQS